MGVDKAQEDVEQTQVSRYDDEQQTQPPSLTQCTLQQVGEVVEPEPCVNIPVQGIPKATVENQGYT